MLEERRVSRRKLIQLGAALGLGSAAASALAACGGGGGGSAESGGNTAATGASGTAGGSTVGGGPEVGKGQVIAKESKVAANAAFPFTDAGTGRPGVLVRLENREFVAYSAACTHQACTVAYRKESSKLACPCHGSVFDPAKGAAVETGPATLPLPELEINVRDGEVFLV